MFKESSKSAECMPYSDGPEKHIYAQNSTKYSQFDHDSMVQWHLKVQPSEIVIDILAAILDFP
jgi:hypothetical protein